MQAWMLSILTGVLGLLFGNILGMLRERHAQSLTARLELLKPVERWLDLANRIIHIIADDVQSLSQNQPFSVGYSIQERVNVGKEISETTPKVLAILQTKSLRTIGTWRSSDQLSGSIRQLNSYLQSVLLPVDDELTAKGATWSKIDNEIQRVSNALALVQPLLNQTFASLAKMKVTLV